MSASSFFLSGEHRPHAIDEIRANLRLMGFGAEASSADSVVGKILNDDNLFAHADQNAFQQVGGDQPKFSARPLAWQGATRL